MGCRVNVTIVDTVNANLDLCSHHKLHVRVYPTVFQEITIKTVSDFQIQHVHYLVSLDLYFIHKFSGFSPLLRGFGI